MRTFYLYEPSLKVNSVQELEEGLNNLNLLITNRDEKNDNFICSPTIWTCDTTQGHIYDLYSSIVSPELQRVIPYLFRSFSEQEPVYNSISDLDVDYPNDCTAFTGINFNDTTVPPLKQVTNLISYRIFVNHCLKNGAINSISEMEENLRTLYPNFDFTSRAIEECIKWKNQQEGLYDKLFELFDDIIKNPFTGGIGETEVLKYMNGVASKRINLAHRVTYRLENKRFTILACSGHYD